MTGPTPDRGGPVVIDDVGEWTTYHGTKFRCPVYLTTGTAGVTARVAILPDISATHPTEAEALAAVTAATALQIATLKASNVVIPWTEPVTPPPGAATKYIFPQI